MEGGDGEGWWRRVLAKGVVIEGSDDEGCWRRVATKDGNRGKWWLREVLPMCVYVFLAQLLRICSRTCVEHDQGPFRRIQGEKLFSWVRVYFQDLGLEHRLWRVQISSYPLLTFCCCFQPETFWEHEVQNLAFAPQERWAVWNYPVTFGRFLKMSFNFDPRPAADCFFAWGFSHGLCSSASQGLERVRCEWNGIVIHGRTRNNTSCHVMFVGTIWMNFWVNLSEYSNHVLAMQF